VLAMPAQPSKALRDGYTVGCAGIFPRKEGSYACVGSRPSVRSFTILNVVAPNYIEFTFLFLTFTTAVNCEVPCTDYRLSLSSVKIAIFID